MKKQLLAFTLIAAISVSAAASWAVPVQATPAPPQSEAINEQSDISQDFISTQQGFPIKIQLNNSYIKMTAPTIIEDDYTLIPIRDLAEALDFKVKWNEKDQSVTMTKENTVIRMQLGNTKTKVNNEEKKMPLAPRLISARTYVPLRFTTEAFNLFVSWDRPSSTSRLYTYIPFVLDTSIGFDVIRKDNLPSPIKNALQLSLGKDQLKTVCLNGNTYFILTMAKKPTSGYSIDIVDVRQIGNRYILYAKYNYPTKDQVVLQVETSPSMIISVVDKVIRPEAIELQIDKPLQGEGLTYKLLDKDYPQEINEYLEANKNKETQHAVNIDNNTYIVMSMGEKTTGGYNIDIEKVSLSNGIVTIDAKYNRPNPDDMVTMQINYPSVVIKLDDIYKGHYEIKYKINK